MEDINARPPGTSWRWAAITAIAPIAWGANYYVIHRFLPDTGPLWGAVIRAVPAGLLLLLLARRLPHGAWWWRSIVLGILNVGAFFVLIHLAAQLLPTSVAAVVMAASPIAMMALAWALVAERPRAAQLVGAGLGIAGVALMVLGGDGRISVAGMVASLTAMVMSSLGFVLAKRWTTGSITVLQSTAWQLVAGGLLIAPFAVALDQPPAPTADTLIGFGYVTLIATALAFSCWFAGLRHLPAGRVGLVGLLNPITGVLLGTVLAAEMLSFRQILGIVVVLSSVVLGQLTFGRSTRAVGPAQSNVNCSASVDTIGTAAPLDPLGPDGPSSRYPVGRRPIPAAATMSDNRAATCSR